MHGLLAPQNHSPLGNSSQLLVFQAVPARLRRTPLQINCAAKTNLPSRLAERHAKKAAQRKEAAVAAAAPAPKKKDVVKKTTKPKQKAAKPLKLSSRLAQPGEVQHEVVRWTFRELPPSNAFLEYIPGRDTLYIPEQLAAGINAYDAGGEHVLRTQQLPKRVLAEVTPLVTRGLQLFQSRSLPHVIDGRASGGPVDVAAFLAQPGVQEQVEQALHRRAARLKAAGQPVPKKQQMLPHVVHISPDQRKVYIGDEHDVTRNGTRIMLFQKAWKSNPLHTWSGGMKMADMPGGHPPKLVASQLSTLLAAEEPQFVKAAEQLWDAFAADPTTAAAAERMQAHLATSPARAASRLGRTAWNAYAFNISYRTGPHLDGKNVAGSYSALLVCEVGAPVAGGFYMLPQYRAALDLRQGVVMFHRSGDKDVGLHGNTGMHVPPQSHRIAVVFYLTELKVDVEDSAEGDASAAAESKEAAGADAPADKGLGSW